MRKTDKILHFSVLKFWVVIQVKYLKYEYFVQIYKVLYLSSQHLFSVM